MRRIRYGVWEHDPIPLTLLSAEEAALLTRPQAELLQQIRAGASRFNGRARKMLEALEKRGLIKLDCEPRVSCGRSSLLWTATPAKDG